MLNLAPLHAQSANIDFVLTGPGVQIENLDADIRLGQASFGSLKNMMFFSNTPPPVVQPGVGIDTLAAYLVDPNRPDILADRLLVSFSQIAGGQFPSIVTLGASFEVLDIPLPQAGVPFETFLTPGTLVLNTHFFNFNETVFPALPPDNITIEVTSIPEPSTLTLLGAGLLLIAGATKLMPLSRRPFYAQLLLAT